MNKKSHPLSWLGTQIIIQLKKNILKNKAFKLQKKNNNVHNHSSATKLEKNKK